MKYLASDLTKDKLYELAKKIKQGIAKVEKVEEGTFIEEKE